MSEPTPQAVALASLFAEAYEAGENATAWDEGLRGPAETPGELTERLQRAVWDLMIRFVDDCHVGDGWEVEGPAGIESARVAFRQAMWIASGQAG